MLNELVFATLLGFVKTLLKPKVIVDKAGISANATLLNS